MGYVVDKWTDPAPGGGRRPRNTRWGHGRRWLARRDDPDGKPRSQAFASKDGAEAHLLEQETRARSGLWVATWKRVEAGAQVQDSTLLDLAAAIGWEAGRPFRIMAAALDGD